MFQQYLPQFSKIIFLIFLAIFALGPGSVLCSDIGNAPHEQLSPLDWLKERLTKKKKPEKLETGPGLVSSKDMKSYCERQIKVLSKREKELQEQISKSKALYELRKQESWNLSLEKRKMEQSNEQDPDRILDMHENWSNAKALESEALLQYRRQSRELLTVQEKIGQCQDEIKKAEKILSFTGQR